MRQHGRRTGQQQRNGGDVASEQRPTTKGNDFLPSIFPLVKCKSNNIIDCVIKPREMPLRCDGWRWCYECGFWPVERTWTGWVCLQLDLASCIHGGCCRNVYRVFPSLTTPSQLKTEYVPLTTRDAENQFIADEDRDENMSVCCLLLFGNAIYFYDMGKIVLNKLG